MADNQEQVACQYTRGEKSENEEVWDYGGPSSSWRGGRLTFRPGFQNGGRSRRNSGSGQAVAGGRAPRRRIPGRPASWRWSTRTACASASLARVSLPVRPAWRGAAVPLPLHTRRGAFALPETNPRPRSGESRFRVRSAWALAY